MRKKILLAFLFLSLIVFPFGQLAVLPLNFPGVRLLWLDLFVFGFALFFLISTFFGKQALKKSFLFWPGLAFLAIVALSLLINLPNLKLNQNLAAFFYLLRLGAYFSFYLSLVGQKIFSKRDLTCYLKTIGFSVAVFGLVQYFFWPDLTALKFLNWDDHYFRLISLFLDPNFTGIILLFTFLLFYFDRGKWLASRGVVLVILLLSISLTYSRSTFLSLFMVGLVAAIVFKRIKFFLLIIGFLFLSISFLPRSSGGEGVKLERISSINARFETAREAIVIFKKKPFLGIGFNAYRYQRQADFLKESFSRAGGGTDNSFLLILATTGIIGLLSFIFLSGKILFLSFKEKEKIIFLSLIALGVHCLFVNSLFYPWVMYWLTVLLGSRENN